MDARILADRIRAQRLAHGWSQAELAARAGVTRQLVAALEAGRHTPNVVAALGLARALGCSVEELCADHEFRSVDGRPIEPGTPVATARVGGAVVAAPLTDVVSAAESWALADARVGDIGLEILPGASDAGIVVVGCDPLLGLLGALVSRRGLHRLVAVHGSSADAIAALRDGRAHGALVHGPPGELPEPGPDIRRWHLAGWRVGLVSRLRTGPPTLDELADRRSQIVRRADGAASQAALVRALRSVGADGRVRGPIAAGHLDVARRVATAGPAVGVTMEPAAIALGLGFAPLEEHVVELWVDDRWAALPAFAALLETMAGTLLGARASVLPGYDLSGSGTERRAG